MADHPQLGVYDLAYVCGGPTRVVTVAVLALRDDEQIAISRALHRIRVVRRAPRDKVESAVLAAIPDAGRPLGALTAAAAESGAVAEIGAALREQRVLPGSPWQLGRIIHAHRLRRRLRANPMDGIDRVAILGPAGIPDAALREVLQTPDPKFEVPDLKLPRLPDRNDRPYDQNADVRTAAQLDVYGPGGAGWGVESPVAGLRVGPQADDYGRCSRSVIVTLRQDRSAPAIASAMACAPASLGWMRSPLS